ncbi:hypothetical protein Tco_1448962 [Tanacetum coccineum]
MVRSFYEMVIQRKQAANVSTHTPEPSRHFNFTCDDDDDDEEYYIPLKDMPQISPSITLAPVSSIMEPEDSLIMENEELSTIPEKESDEFIKSNVEDLIPIPRESEDTSSSDSESVLPSSDDFSPIFEEKSMTFSNPLCWELLKTTNSSSVSAGYIIEFMLEDLEAVPADYVPADLIYRRDYSREKSKEGWEKRCERNTVVHPPVSLDEHVAVQRENKVRTLLLQALPEDHMPDFHHYDDARDIWMAFTEFSVTEEEGLHKGYDRFQKILSQLNQVQARPDNDDINLKFLRALPSSGHQLLGIKNKRNWSIVMLWTSGRSDNIMECVLHSFVADNEPDQDMIYEDFDQVDQLEMEELDLKWQMAMLLP